MSNKHIKRNAAPKFWEIRRKEYKYTVHPSPGPHSVKSSLPLLIVIRDYMGYSKTSREAKRIIRDGKIVVDNITIKDYRYPIGLMDVITFNDLKENFRVLINANGNLFFHKIKKEEANIKPLKIINKKIIKNKMTQINFYDGKNKIVDKDQYKTSDTIVYDLVNRSFRDHLRFEKGAMVYLIKGNRTGQIGILDSIKQKHRNEPIKIVLKKGNDRFETLKDYAFVVGKDTTIISIPNENEIRKQ